jgi:TRAP-type C4-dicarboxylate transport system permease small subunit
MSMKIETWRRRLDAAIGALLATALGLAVLAVVWQVASRYLLGAPSSFTDELVRFLLIWIGLIGGSYAAGRNQNIAIDLLAERLSPARQARLRLLIDLLILLFALAVLLGGGALLVGLMFELGQRSAALSWSLAAVYLALPIAGVVLLLNTLFDLAALRQETP